MDDNMVDNISKGFSPNLSPQSTKVSLSNDLDLDSQCKVIQTVKNCQIENDELFLSLKSHIDSQFKLNQLNQSRILSFERFRKYCQRVTQFGDGTSVNDFDQEQFRNEYNRFDRNYRHWRKRIRKLRKETKSSMSTRYQSLYDTLYELFAKIESLEKSINNNHSKMKSDDRYLSGDQIYPEISLNVIEPPAPVNLDNISTNNNNNNESIQENFNCFVDECLQKFYSQHALLDHLFEKHSSDGNAVVAKTKSKRGRKPNSKIKTTKTKNSVVTRRSKVQSSKNDKIAPKSLSTKPKRTSKKRVIIKDESSSDTDLPVDEPPPPKKKRGRAKKSPTEPAKVYHCDTEGCQYSTTISSNMKLHKVFHSDERPFQCDKCDLAFKMKGDLKRHQNIHEGKRFACTVEGCNVNYSTLRRMRKHVKIFHTKEAPLLHCDSEGCQYATYNSEYLKIHRKIHTDERPFKCPDCAMAFKSASNLWSHKLKHQSEHRFKCDFEGCGYTTYNKEYLQNHQVIHTGDRPYKCVWPECGQAFKSSSGLWSHKMIHENQRRYKCQVEGCDYAGNLWRNLHKHEEAMHGKKKLAQTTANNHNNNNNNSPNKPGDNQNFPNSNMLLKQTNVCSAMESTDRITSCISAGPGPIIDKDIHSQNVHTLL